MVVRALAARQLAHDQAVKDVDFGDQALVEVKTAHDGPSELSGVRLPYLLALAIVGSP
jgi:hypothetical protein